MIFTAYKREYGCSPHKYVRLTRINPAKHLLKTTDLPVKVAAASVVYQNMTTFINAFSGRVRLSFSLFRKYRI
ncbi:MAG: AraC family transcriptional regulator [Clostridia bacterium]|nr:AraC family transcriptional regulator [Clostridia bacterium]